MKPQALDNIPNIRFRIERIYGIVIVWLISWKECLSITSRLTMGSRFDRAENAMVVAVLLYSHNVPLVERQNGWPCECFPVTYF